MFLKKHKTNVNISELVLYFSCPRKVYYAQRDSRASATLSFPQVEHMILRETGLSYPELLKTYSSKDEELFRALEELLFRTAEEIKFIHPEELADVPADIIEEATGNLQSGLRNISDNLLSFLRTESDTGLVRQLESFRPGSLFHSELLGLSGIPAGIVDIDGTLSPLIIKTGRCPDNGLWANDRLHLAALAMLLEEAGASPVKTGIATYARQGVIRRMNIRSDDRRQVLSVLPKVRRIKDGSMPDRKESALCENCAHSPVCNVQSSLASKFF
ncbi:Dna2/Cas4 domain-containing protein [Methanolobus chelungpuianus]|uniref:Dna2/Cas4 domain-containing protein n=1 Tax=Methanolobus chelungpuianus TaxID=502115 RepID=UPI00211435FF|nr:Dna2/Cas4 domain-containing protein [Methanolobus chelungpuianus]